MRKLHKWQILELFKILKETLTEGRSKECRQLAHNTYNFICNIGLQSSQTAGLLKEFIELLNDADVGNSNEILLEHLNHIRFNAQSEFHANRIEMVFLCYKASMSDSLESIYRAAKNDPNCDAHWMPIPYFDRKPDGTLGEMHYEGAECYASDIVVTDWREYNIEARHPDIIFTFNPYDGGNHVTSVHPDYYCERLRDLTDMLVYVPYFVSSENDGELPEHFCISAGSVYAHKVIVQSEKVRGAYIRALKNQFGDKLDHAIGRAEDRIIALGSPKFDKVMNSKREDFTLPQAWNKLIGNKKVVLYNSSLGTILLGTETYLLKIRSVIDTFRQRKDVVLWWRPHPLSDATYKSMRPHVMMEYKKIVADYMRDGWGIFDDTPDLHRALAWTDAYYGDASSLVALYERTKKPLMIQSPWLVDDLKDAIAFECICNDDKYHWFSALYFNALFRIDKGTYQVEFIANFPDENLMGFRLFTGAALCNGKIYFAPYLAENISVYDINSNEFTLVKIIRPDNYNFNICYLDKSKFNSSVVYKNCIFFIPYAYPGIIRYNTESGDIDYFDDFVPLFQQYLTNNMPYFFFNSCTVDNYIFAASFNGNAVLAFNMDTCKSEIYEVGNKNNTYSAICYHDGYLWLLPRKPGPIVRWKLRTSTFDEYPNLPRDFKCDDFCFHAFCYANGNLWAFPLSGNMALKIDPGSGRTEKAEVFQQDCKVGHNFPAWRFTMAISDGNAIMAYSQARNRFIIYDCKTGEYKTKTIGLSSEAKASLMPTLLRALADSGVGQKHKDLLRENSILNLDSLIDCLTLRDASSETTTTSVNGCGTAGETIYRYCVGCLSKGGR